LVISDKQRKVMKAEAVKRLEYLVSWGLDKDILKQFKNLGRIHVDEVYINTLQDARIKRAAGFDTYLFLEGNTMITEDMLEARQKLEREGYLVYLIVRSRKTTNNEYLDKIDYFFIDTPDTMNYYEEDEYDFKTGKAKAYVQLKTANETKQYFDYEVNYKMKMSHVVEMAA